MAFPLVCVLLSVGLHPEFVMIPPKSVVPSLCGLDSSPCVVFLQSRVFMGQVGQNLHEGEGAVVVAELAKILQVTCPVSWDR